MQAAIDSNSYPSLTCKSWKRFLIYLHYHTLKTKLTQTWSGICIFVKIGTAFVFCPLTVQTGIKLSIHLLYPTIWPIQLQCLVDSIRVKKVMRIVFWIFHSSQFKVNIFFLRFKLKKETYLVCRSLHEPPSDIPGEKRVLNITKRHTIQVFIPKHFSKTSEGYLIIGA